MRSIIVFLYVAVALPNAIRAQSTDSLVVDTLKKEHSFKKALLYSAALPGLGQIYNHKAMPKGQKKAFWKVPLIYAGLGATGYFFQSNQSTQKALKTEYTNRMEGNVTDPQWADYDDEAVLTLYQQYLNQRDLSIIGIGIVYLLQIADAAVEAHFVGFDVSDNISMRLKLATPARNSIGLGVSFNFR
jgi:hypothetical protein